MPLSTQSINGFFRNTKAKAAGVSVLATALIAGTGFFGYQAFANDIDLNVDGQTMEVSSHADTVGDLLADQDIELGEHDYVSPEPASELEDGGAVTVKYGRELSLEVDGKEHTYWVTSRSVDGALREIGRTFPKRAEFSTSRSASISREGMALEVVTPKKVVVELAGKKPVEKQIAALSVGDALDKLEVDVDKDDKINHKRTAEVRKGMKIVYTEVDKRKKSVEDETVDFDTIEREDSSMYEGEEETIREGQTGSRDVTYRVVRHNGEVAKRIVLKQNVTEKPVDEIVKVGTKEREVATGSAPAGVWAQLAECESGGDPNAVNPAGPYYGLYQFTASTWASVGGTGIPTDHDAGEQTKRAQILQARSGWGQWPACAAELGLL